MPYLPKNIYDLKLPRFYFQAICVLILSLIFAFSSGSASALSRTALVERNVPAGDVHALISAIDDANFNLLDVINLAPDSTYVFDVKHNDVDGANALPSIRTNIVINGNGSELVRDSESEPFRFFHIFFDVGTLTLNDLDITGGLADAPDVTDRNGGAIYNEGVLFLNNSFISDNEAPHDGGGIYNIGVFEVFGSEFDGNRTGRYGGGLYNSNQSKVTESMISGNMAGKLGGGIYSSHELQVFSSTIDGNRTEGPLTGGGGLYNIGGEATITNSTISGNSTSGSLNGGGGGIKNEGGALLHVANSTIAYNSAESSTEDGGGGGIINNGNGTTRLQNTILAKNTSSIAGPDCLGIFASMGYNLIGDIGEPSECTIAGTLTGNVIGQDPMLGELRSYGGATSTHTLLEGSPAIDQIPQGKCLDAANNPLGLDQRGEIRPSDGDDDDSLLCDIGSFEVLIICGDIDGNATVEPSDTSLILGIALGIAPQDFLRLVLGDMDRNGELSLFDAIIGLKSIADGVPVSDCGLP